MNTLYQDTDNLSIQEWQAASFIKRNGKILKSRSGEDEAPNCENATIYPRDNPPHRGWSIGHCIGWLERYRAENGGAK